MSESDSRPHFATAADWRTLIQVCFHNAGRTLTQDSRPGELLMRFATSARTLHEGFRRVFQPRGWTDHKIIVLLLLSGNAQHSFTPSELARQIGVTRASMTKVLLGLELRRWIERARNSTDRRTVRIRVTPAGRRVVVDALVLYLEVACEVVRSMPAEDVPIFVHNCERMARASERLGRERSPPDRQRRVSASIHGLRGIAKPTGLP